MSSLPRRLDALRAALHALEEAPSDRARRHAMLRRVHALGAAARVLGFASVAEVLGEAERALRRSARPGPQHAAFQDVSRALDLLPSLVLGTVAVPRAGSDHPDAGPAPRGSPISVLVYGAEHLADALNDDTGRRLEIERADEVGRARDLMRTIAPDAAVVDADRRGARELVEHLLSDPQIERVPLLVVGSFAGPEAATAFVKLGAERVLPKPVSPETLRRTLFELHDLASSPRGSREPVGELTVSALADRISAEVRRGLIESLEGGVANTAVDFGDGADVLGAVWGAVARVRELVTVRSAGNVRFQPTGPEGAVPLAPFPSEDRRAGERGARPGRSGEDVSLKGRRIVVADDDPAVVWFMLGLFRAVGAEVIEAHDGDRALERVFESSPDLVVSDVLMPGRDGFSLCHEIKRDVVARDVPVILLSWKEDLLQRVRELGADADGYLRKEAAASTVVERVREVLRPRARVEQRLSAGGEARGRLDGITPYLVLDVVCRTTPDATLTLRDAVYLYEAQIRGGRVRSVTRSATDGSFERGEHVLASLLGVNAGRFAVSRDQGPCRSDFQASTATLLAGPIRRARAALAAVAAERLPRVERVAIDRAAVGRYLECTPEPARKLVEALDAGASPRELLMAGKASSRLLESVLSDLARRGAVLSVEREDGAVPGISGDAPEPAPAPPRDPEPPIELTPSGVRAAREADPTPEADATPEPAGLDTAWSDRDAERAVLEMTASSEAVSDVSVEPPSVHDAELRSSPVANPTSAAFEPAPEAPPEPGWFGFQLDASGPNGVPPVGPVEAATRLEPTPDAPPEAAQAEPEPHAPETLSAESMSVFEALTAEPRAETERLPTLDSDSPPLPVAREMPREPTPRGGLTAPIERTLTIGARPATGPWPVVSDEREQLGHTLPLGSQLGRPGPRPALRVPDQDDDAPSPSIADVFAAALANDDQPATIAGRAPSDAPPEPSLADAPATQADFPPRDAVHGAVVRDAALRDAAARAAAEPSFAIEAPASPKPPESYDGEIPPVQTGPDSSEQAEPADAARARADLPFDATLVSVAPPERPESVRDAMQTTDIGPVAPEEPTSSSRSVSTRRRGDRGGLWRTLGLAGVAFGAAFVLVRFVIVPQFRAHQTQAPALSPSALIAAAQASAANAPAAPPAPSLALRTEILAILPDMPVRAGEGVIEIVTGREDELYVDGVSIGRGPRKPVSFAPGRHELKVVRGEQSGALSVEISAGWRTRVTVDPMAPGP